ncbi:type III-B CRISPR module RAMP protein Cmr4 [Acidilobus sp.]|uniref:type III-B CRISPR module RAMP protein Cmr4 n=1 Tax=Acidilobus sp. TaxID=1872109 RepID=UPI003D0923EE
MAQSGPAAGIPIIVYSVTPLHVGSGRSLGAVDLPIQRDPYNYPVVYSSSFKGALKSHCAKRRGLPLGERGRMDCSRAPECCCLFGPEVDDESGSGLLDVSDLVPLFIPVPSLTHGYIYATSTYLLDRAADLLEFAGEGDLLNFIKGINIKGNKNGGPAQAQGAAPRQGGEADAAGVERPLLPLASGNAQSSGNVLSLFKGAGKLSEKLEEGIVVFGDDEGAEILERAYIRVTRNRIDLKNKTVATGALWTEEYLPQGTVLLGVLMPSVPKRNPYCSSNKKDEKGGSSGNNKEEVCDYNCFKEIFNKYLSETVGGQREADGWVAFYVVMGGKETVGKGFVKVKVKAPR